MRALLFAALTLTACDLYVEDDDPVAPPANLPEYDLVPRGNVATLGAIAAVTWDGSQHWIITRTEIGNYWTPDRLDVFRYDVQTRTASEPFVLTDHWQRPTGAAWIQGKLWIHYDGNGSGLITTLDPQTGIETPQFNVGWGFGDIDTDGNLLYLAQADVSAVRGPRSRRPHPRRRLDRRLPGHSPRPRRRHSTQRHRPRAVGRHLVLQPPLHRRRPRRRRHRRRRRLRHQPDGPPPVPRPEPHRRRRQPALLLRRRPPRRALTSVRRRRRWAATGCDRSDIRTGPGSQPIGHPPNPAPWRQPVGEKTRPQ